MKKNKMMRVASALLVAVLMTTSVISGTFAKYVTQDSATDTARVAKWGVVLQVAGKLFGETYKDAIVANDAGSFTVQANDFASADDYVVAPGTASNDGFHISLTGTPEVSTKVKVTIEAQNVFLSAGKYGVMVEVPSGAITAVNFATFIADGLYTKSGDTYTKVAVDAVFGAGPYYTLEDYVDTSSLGTYYPVVYAMTGDTTYSGDDSKDTINELAAVIAAKFGTATTSTNANKVTTYTVTSAPVGPNTDLDTQFKIDDIKITWAWAYEATADTVTTEDMADTILGLLMTRAEAGSDALDGTVVKLNDALTSAAAPTEYTHYCLDTMFSIDITVEQVD